VIRTVKIKYGFRNASDSQIVIKGIAIAEGLTDNPHFRDLPVPISVLRQSIDDFQNALSASALGGTAATAEKNRKRAELISIIRKIGHYVQVHSNNDPAILLTSGFDIQNPNRTQAPLAVPSIVGLEHARSTQLKVRIKPVPNARGYDVRFAPAAAVGAPGPWQQGGFFTNSRAIVLTDLTPGQVYVVQVRALGGSTLSSDWSDPVSRMSI